jgi:UMF1 family MFS transporter
VAESTLSGTVAWGRASSLAALIVAFAGPPLGAIADRSGGRKLWLLGFTLATALLTAMLYFVKPAAGYVPLALSVFVLAAVASELAMVFYNSMLPSIAPQQYLGRISGWGWGLGYAGGLACLVLALAFLIEPSSSWFDLNRDEAEQIRATMLLAAAWIALFSTPLFLFTRDPPQANSSLGQALRGGLSALRETARFVRQRGDVVRFLIAYLFYANGLTALFLFGGVYAVGTFGLTMTEMMRFAIALNISAGLGAASFAWLDDWIGPKRTIAIAIAGLLVSGAVLVAARSALFLWIFGFVLGLFVGPAQAAGRSMMARLSPKLMETAMFGFYALAGKATAFASPLVFSIATQIFQSQRAGMASILLFFVTGLVFLLSVKEPSR